MCKRKHQTLILKNYCIYIYASFYVEVRPCDILAVILNFTGWSAVLTLWSAVRCSLLTLYGTHVTKCTHHVNETDSRQNRNKSDWSLNIFNVVLKGLKNIQFEFELLLKKVGWVLTKPKDSRVSLSKVWTSFRVLMCFKIVWWILTNP